MTRTELMQQIIQKQDELIEVLKQELNILADNKSTEVIAFIGVKRLEIELNDSLSALKKQLEECEKKSLTEDEARELESKMGF